MTNIGLNYKKVEKEVSEMFGIKAWRLLQPETRIGIITSDMCYKYFISNEHESKLDYSSSIMPLMKGLECELKHSYYDGYLSYLKSQYPEASDYANKICKNCSDLESVADSRKKLIKFSTVESKLLYKTLSDEFTIGEFRYAIGVNKFSKMIIDEPFIDYCFNCLYNNCFTERKILVRWICQLIRDIEALRRLRNESSHAGIIQNKIDATTAIDELVRIKKILTRIVDPTF